MISHELRTIFIHVPRTGGTSVEIALVGNNWWKIDPQTKHLDWKQAKSIYSKYWDHYLKFSIVRNPWDWLASLYFSHNRSGRKTWEEFVHEPNMYPHEPEFMSQSDIIGHDVDMLLRFETLHEDFLCLCQKLGIKRDLPHAQVGEGAYKHYSEIYSDEQMRLVAKLLENDIRRFGYKFINQEVSENQYYKMKVAELNNKIAHLEQELETLKASWLGRLAMIFRHR